MIQRDKMLFLLGQLESIAYILDGTDNQAYYDLIDCIIVQYKTILREIYPDFKE